MEQASLLVWAQGGFTYEYECAVHMPECKQVYICYCAKAVSLCMVSDLELQPVGIDNRSTGIIHRDVALQSFIFLLSHLLSSAVIQGTLPAELQDF